MFDYIDEYLFYILVLQGVKLQMEHSKNIFPMKLIT